MYVVKESDIMLIAFKFKNYKCFYEENILDLSATLEKRHSGELINVNGNKLLPVIAIHGANASGKSTILDAIKYMLETVRYSFYGDTEKNLVTFPFAFSNKTKKENSEFEISINLGDSEYRYGFSLNKNCISEEWLYVGKFELGTKSKEKKIFEREGKCVTFAKKYNNDKSIWELFSSGLNVDKMLTLSILGIKEESGILRDIYTWMTNIDTKIDTSFESNVSITVLNNNKKLDKAFNTMINEIDPCLKGIFINKEKKEEEELYQIFGIHNNIDENNEEFRIPLSQESDGTIKAFNILPSVLLSLEKGSLLCIDELDTRLHPLLFKKIVNMYKDKSINKHNAQLIFTSHSTFMLNNKDMRRDEIYLVEKNKLAQSKLYSLSLFRDVRVDTDYEKKYLSGAFGAIPFSEEE
ncbi:MAG: ATP-binding protein [Bacilli bacterium]